MIEKSNILYVYEPDFYPDFYAEVPYKIRLKYYDYTDKYGKIWLKNIIPNVVPYINGKPYYEVNEITEVKTEKEYDFNPHPTYTLEHRKFYDDEVMKIEDIDWVYRKLLISDLVVDSPKNHMMIDSNAKKDGNKWICTDKFTPYTTDWFHKDLSASTSFYPNEVFDNYEDCKRAMEIKILNTKACREMSDVDYSLMDACVYLKRRGIDAKKRRAYLEEMKKLDNVEDVELYVRDGKVYANHQPDNRKPAPYPEFTEEIKRSPKKYREWIAKCNEIEYDANWYIHKKELII